jgi:hypothetical protein
MHDTAGRPGWGARARLLIGASSGSQRDPLLRPLRPLRIGGVHERRCVYDAEALLDLGYRCARHEPAGSEFIADLNLVPVPNGPAARGSAEEDYEAGAPADRVSSRLNTRP